MGKADAVRMAVSQSFEELENAASGTTLVAGADIMTKSDDGRWYRPDDGSYHDSAGLADFHAWSGYALIAPQCGSSSTEEA
jgi:hypothetical protein